MIPTILVKTGKDLRPARRTDEDISDRIIGTYSVVILGILTFILTTSYFFGRPLSIISCWCPAEFTPEMTRYVETICWSSHTYHVPENCSIPIMDGTSATDTRPDQDTTLVSYYQWVPFILMGIAFALYLPGFIWRSSVHMATLELKSIVAQATAIDGNMPDPVKLKNVAKRVETSFVGHMEAYGSDEQDGTLLGCPCAVSPSHGNFLTSTCLFVKVMYFATSCSLFYAMNRFLQLNICRQGFDILRAFFSLNGLTANNGNPAASELRRRFPYGSFCEFDIRGLGDRFQHYVVQCTLPVNVFNEKFFLLLWMWLLLCSVVAGISLICVMLRATKRSQRRFVMKLMQNHLYAFVDHHVIMYFVERYCCSDGIMMLRLLNRHCDKKVFEKLLDIIWTDFTESQKWRFMGVDFHDS